MRSKWFRGGLTATVGTSRVTVSGNDNTVHRDCVDRTYRIQQNAFQRQQTPTANIDGICSSEPWSSHEDDRLLIESRSETSGPIVHEENCRSLRKNGGSKRHLAGMARACFNPQLRKAGCEWQPGHALKKRIHRKWSHDAEGAPARPNAHAARIQSVGDSPSGCAG
jgi:hypothetical protein